VIGVWDARGALAAAVAELPLSVRAAADPHGAIAVVPGDAGWPGALRAAVGAGAIAVVLVEPTMGLDVPGPIDVPVVVVRRRLAAGPSPAVQSSAVVAECSATEATLASAVRDAVGWARELSGGDLRLRTRASGTGGELAVLETADGPTVSLTVQVMSGVPDGAVIRVTALGVVRRQVVVDDAAMLVELTTAVEGSTSVETGRFETPERAGVRRLLSALESGDLPGDLGNLAHDTAIAHSILGRPE
jgi:hypothetical protein